MGDKARAKWSNDAIKCLLELCIEEVNKVGRNGISLQRESWSRVGQKIEEVFGFKTTQKQLKNEYDYLRTKYAGWVYLKNKTGNLYNPETNTFNLTKEEWEQFFKGHRNATSLRTTPLPFPDLCSALFDGTSATGSRGWTPSSSRQRSRMSSSSYAPHLQTLQIGDVPAIDEDANDDDGDDDGDDDAFAQGSEFGGTFFNDEEQPNTPQSRAAPSQANTRPMKKSKNNVSMAELKGDMSRILHKFERDIGPTVDDCVEKLEKSGVDENDRRYLAAFSIFGESRYLREAWLRLPDKPDLLKRWISMQGEKMGLL